MPLHIGGRYAGQSLPHQMQPFLRTYAQRLRCGKLALQLPLTDLFAPAIPEEHYLHPVLRHFFQYIFSETPPQPQNDEFNHTVRKWPVFPWSVQIDGKPGSGKSAILKLIARPSMLHSIPNKELQSVELLYGLQIDEKEFVSWVHAQAERILTETQMTSESRAMDVKFEKKRQRKMKNSIDFQLSMSPATSASIEVVDIVENPLSRVQDRLSAICIDDCENFYLSQMEKLFPDLYCGSPIRPLVFANSSPSLMCSRYLNRRQKAKQTPMFSYVYNLAWKELTDIEAQRVEKLPKSAKGGGIDRFLKPIAAKATDGAATNVARPAHVDLKTSFSRIHVEEPSKLPGNIVSRKVNASSIAVAQELKQLRYLNKQCSTEAKVRRQECSQFTQCEYEKTILQTDFYSITLTKDHFTPIACQLMVDLQGSLANSRDEEETDEDDLSDSCEILETAADLFRTCAKAVLFASLYSSQIVALREDQLNDIQGQVAHDATVLDACLESLLSSQASTPWNLRLFCNRANFLLGCGDDALAYLERQASPERHLRRYYNACVVEYLICNGHEPMASYLADQGYSGIPSAQDAERWSEYDEVFDQSLLCELTFAQKECRQKLLDYQFLQKDLSPDALFLDP